MKKMLFAAILSLVGGMMFVQVPSVMAEEKITTMNVPGVV